MDQGTAGSESLSGVRDLQPSTSMTASVWAKSLDDGARWLPLVEHLEDAGAVAAELWGDRLSRSQRARLADELGGAVLAPKVGIWLAGAHDVGKASAAFSWKVPSLQQRMRRAGFSFPTMTARAEREAPHGLVGQLALEAWLADRGWRPRAARQFASIVGGHHGVFPTTNQLSPPGGTLEALRHEGPEWHRARGELLDRAQAMSRLTDQDLKDLSRVRLSRVAQSMLTGFLIQCDWIASSADLFPLRDPDDLPLAQPMPASRRAAAAVRLLGLPPSWDPEPTEDPGQLLGRRFDLPPSASARPSQRALVEAVARTERPCFALLEAPTGEGKTEAALTAAEILAARFGANGVFVALPTRATSDAMFSRVLAWMDKALVGTSASLVLSHGAAEFNDDYAGLFDHAATFAPLYDEGHTGEGRRVDEHAAVAHWWLRGRKTAALASFGVGTVDQLLFMALKARHLVLRHVGLTGRVVIIDEIHAADDFMLVFMERALEWLGASGTPVLGLSATLPPDRRRRLLGAYERGVLRGEGEDIYDDDPPSPSVEAVAQLHDYPLVSLADGRRAVGTVVEASSRRSKVRLTPFGDDDDRLVAAFRSALENGGCAAVVRNTVDRAQSIYLRLRDVFPAEEVVLLHSRFLAGDRRRLEQRIVEALGPRGIRPERLIVCTTQVIEQSLDLDFDLMASDLAPMDLLIQRAGRIHRHARPQNARPAALAEPELLITGADGLGSGHVPRVDRGSSAVYGMASLLRTAAVLDRHLPAHEGCMSSPDDVAHLVRQTYDPSAVPPAGWEEDWAEAEARARQLAADRRQKASAFLIPPPDSASLEELSRGSGGEAREEGAGRAQVRDIDESLSVIAVQRVNGRMRSLPWLDAPFAGRLLDEPWIEDGLARAVARCSVALPSVVFRRDSERVNAIIDQLESNGTDGWRQSRWLRGTVPLVLDESMSAVLDNVRLTYDIDLGLLHSTSTKGIE